MTPPRDGGFFFAASLPRPASRGQAQRIPPEVLEGLNRSSLRGLTPVLVKGSLTDVAVMLLQDPGQPDTAPRAVLKFSSSINGITALERNAGHVVQGENVVLGEKTPRAFRIEKAQCRWPFEQVDRGGKRGNQFLERGSVERMTADHPSDAQ